jgi:hypothetical protein
MLREEEGLSDDLTGRTLGWQSDGCGRAVRSDGGHDLSSSKSKFLRKRNPNEGGEWMWWQIVSLSMPFIGRRREGRWCCGGEMTAGVGWCDRVTSG